MCSYFGTEFVVNTTFQEAFRMSEECVYVSQMGVLCCYANISGLFGVYLCVFTYEICWDIMCFFSPV